MNAHFIFSGECLRTWKLSVTEIADKIRMIGPCDSLDDDLLPALSNKHNHSPFYEDGAVIEKNGVTIAVLVYKQAPLGVKLESNERLAMAAEMPAASLWRRKVKSYAWLTVEKRLVETGAIPFSLKSGRATIQGKDAQ
jgi:hypothetical protein